MRNTLLVIVALVVCIAAEAKGSKRKKQKAKKANNIESVEMMRTGCFGHCPTYRIVVEKCGIVTYHAIQFNDDTGVFQKNIGEKKVAELFAAYAKYRLDTCREMYENLIPDLPNLNFVVNYKDKTKKIYAATFGPDFFKTLAKLTNEAGLKKDNTGWKKIADKAEY